MERASFFLTTPALSPTRELDLSLALEFIGADVVARYQRGLGRDVRLVVEALEHGRDVERAAYERGGTPKHLADESAERWDNALKALCVAHDDLVRTTEARHQRVVKALFLKLFDQGDIYKGSRQSRYCPRCEELRPDSRGAEAACPECGEPLADVAQEAYFLRASKHAKAIIDHIEGHPDFITPASCREEILAAAAEEGIADPCISGAGRPWAIAVPISPQHAVEGWFDGLISYLTASGYLAEPQAFERTWPPCLQIIDPAALRAHALAWPAVLIAAGLALPERLLLRGSLRLQADLPPKLAASLSDPVSLADRIGSDALRYVVLSSAAYTDDSTLSLDRLVERANRRLVDQLGRLVETTLAAVTRRSDASIPRPGDLGSADQELAEAAAGLFDRTGQRIASFEFAGALEEIWQLVAAALRYADHAGLSDPDAPAPGARRLDTPLYVLAEVCRLTAHSLHPFLPRAAGRIEASLGVDYEGQAAPTRRQWGITRPQTRVQEPHPIFSRIVLPTE